VEIYSLISPFATLRVMKLSFRSYTSVTDFRYSERQVSGAMISPIWIEGTNDTSTDLESTEREPMKQQGLTQVKGPFLYCGDERY
jgi:hypothetical protein